MCRAIATLFLVLSVFAEVAVVTAADPADAAAVAEIQKLGGTVRLLSSQNDDREVDFQFSADKLGDAGLAHLAKIKSLVVVSLKGTKITDAGLAHLKGLVTVRRLHLENTAVGDAGVAQLTGLVNLEYLNLYGTKVSDAGLVHLKNLKKLKSLYLWKTDVTDTGVEQLAAALPELTIVQGAEINHPGGNVVKRLVIDDPTLPIAGQPWKVVGIRYEEENPGAKAKATVRYRAKGTTTFASANLVRSKDGRFEATIPGSATKTPFQYYIEVREAKRPPSTYPPSGAKGPAEVAPDAKPPVLAAAPTVSGAKSYRVDLAWKKATDDRGISGYRVYRGKDAASAVAKGNLLSKVAADKLLFSDEKPPAGETVFYAIEPLDLAGRNGDAQSIKVEVPKDVAPENKLKVAASSGSKAVVLSWTGETEPDVTHLLVFRSDKPGGELTQVAEVAKTAATLWIDKNVKSDTKYRYVVKLRDGGKNVSEPSAEIQAQAGGYLRRINCAGPLVASADGSPWEADDKSVAGTSRFTTKVKVTKVPPGLEAVYRTERWARRTVRYRFDVTPGRYQVVMHFAETNATFSVKGKRTFDVSFNGKKRHTAVDIFAAAGKATAWQLSTDVDVTGKELVIELLKNKNGPAIKGLEVRQLAKK